MTTAKRIATARAELRAASKQARMIAGSSQTISPGEVEQLNDRICRAMRQVLLLIEEITAPRKSSPARAGKAGGPVRSITVRKVPVREPIGPFKRGRKPRLSPEQCERLRFLYHNSSCSLQRIAEHYGVSVSLASRVINRQGSYEQR